jgi:hypothetical protein
MLNAVKLVIMLSINKPNFILLCVAMKSVITLSVLILSVVILCVLC